MSTSLSFEATLSRARHSEPFSVDFTVDERVEKEIEVADGVTDQSVDISDITTGTLVIVKAVSKAISVKFVTGGTSFSIAEGKSLIMFTTVTSVLISNASGSTATVLVMYFGT